MRFERTGAAIVLCACLASAPAFAQPITSRGFADARLFLYPQDAANDPTNGVGEALLRYEPSWKPAAWLLVNGSFDARMDTHHQVERRWFVDWQDRGVLRPPLSVRRLSAVLSRGGLNVEIGKQFIRWGKADVLNPTDRFAPRDFLSVVDNDFLGVTGARATYESGGTTLDLVWVPHFTPSRIPLFDQRWTVVNPPEGGSHVPISGAEAAQGSGRSEVAQGLARVDVAQGSGQSEVAQGFSPVIPIVDAGSRFPGGSQLGVRVNQSGPGYEFSLSFYNGHNHLPLIDARLSAVPRLAVELTRFYPQMRMWGGDFALPNRWVTVKGEMAYFTSKDAASDEYGIYVLQAERQVGEWVFVGGYAGDFVTRTGVAPATVSSLGAPGAVALPFAADRGLARAFLGRASVSLDVNANLAFQAAVRRNGHGTWLQGQYSRAFAGHLRATIEGNVIRGQDDDFLGQFHRNSNVNLAIRYSF